MAEKEPSAFTNRQPGPGAAHAKESVRVPEKGAMVVLSTVSGYPAPSLSLASTPGEETLSDLAIFAVYASFETVMPVAGAIGADDNVTIGGGPPMPLPRYVNVSGEVQPEFGT